MYYQIWMGNHSLGVEKILVLKVQCFQEGLLMLVKEENLPLFPCL